MGMNKMVQIEADKVRNLKFNYNALIMLEEDFGIDVSNLGKSMKLSDLRKMVYCGLKHEDADLTLEEAGDIIDEMMDKKGIEYVGEKVGEAISKAFGNPQGKGGTQPKGKK